MVDPFLKWPGGKRWFVSQYAHLLPSSYKRYIEPFVGGGAVFFHISPKKSILADTNEELINAYKCIKSHHHLLDELLKEYQAKHSKYFYYRVRETIPTDRLNRAARFIYLNRTCFNGMYRVNLSGEFNVPIGTKVSVAYPPGYLAKVSKTFHQTKISVMDFEKTLAQSETGDFVFIDPPYTVMHNNNGFIKYNARLFSWADQVRLANSVKQTAARGVSILVSNADHSDIRSLYKDFGEHIQIRRNSFLSGSAKGRRATTELIIRAYTTKS